MEEVILNHRQIEQKINRLSVQIIENTYGINTIYLGGIQGNGYYLAKIIQEFIQKTSNQNIILFEININKNAPLSQPINISIEPQTLNNQTIILIDDVINSGKTMQYALIKILQQPIKEIYTVVLIDRKHRKFPIKANFFGLQLSTTLKNHVKVSFLNNKFSALLS